MAPLLATRLADLSRSELSELAEMAINAIDGGPDLEPDDEDHCEAGDDGCGLFSRWRGGAWWGSHEEAGKDLPVPCYDIDQTQPLLGR